MFRWIAAFWLSLSSLSSAGAQDHASAETYHRKGMALYRSHDFAGALRELARAVEIDPHYAEAWNDLAVIHRQQGDLTGAIHGFRNAIAEKPGFAGAVYNLSLALEASRDIRGAIEQVRRVIALVPRMPQGHARYGRLLADRNQPESARDALRRALQLDSSLT